MNTLTLTADEKKVYLTLPESLREGWQILDETQTSYETLEALEMRIEISPLRRHPLLQEYLKRFEKGESVEKLPLPDLSQEDMGEFFFSIGARGMTELMKSVLGNVKTDDDIRLLSSIGEMRHKLLETNASISYV